MVSWSSDHVPHLNNRLFAVVAAIIDVAKVVRGTGLEPVGDSSLAHLTILTWSSVCSGVWAPCLLPCIYSIAVEACFMLLVVCDANVHPNGNREELIRRNEIGNR